VNYKAQADNHRTLPKQPQQCHNSGEGKVEMPPTIDLTTDIDADTHQTSPQHQQPQQRHSSGSERAQASPFQAQVQVEAQDQVQAQRTLLQDDQANVQVQAQRTLLQDVQAQVKAHVQMQTLRPPRRTEEGQDTSTCPGQARSQAEDTTTNDANQISTKLQDASFGQIHHLYLQEKAALCQRHEQSLAQVLR
jgi:hypothetical protein